MPYVQETSSNVFAPITGQLIYVVRNGEPNVSWPLDILSIWSRQALEDDAKVFWAEPFAPPEGKQITGSPSYSRVDGAVVETYAVVDAPPPPVPLIISDRQFFQALALMSAITQQEALDAVRTGTIPAQMMVYVNAIADEVERFSATMLLSGAVEFRRDHPLVGAFMTANGWTEQQADDLWRFAATL